MGSSNNVRYVHSTLYTVCTCNAYHEVYGTQIWQRGVCVCMLWHRLYSILNKWILREISDLVSHNSIAAVWLYTLFCPVFDCVHFSLVFEIVYAHTPKCVTIVTYSIHIESKQCAQWQCQEGFNSGKSVHMNLHYATTRALGDICYSFWIRTSQTKQTIYIHFHPVEQYKY